MKQDIDDLKYLYFENPKNRIKLYLLSDIISRSLSKYVSIDNLNKLKQKKLDDIIKLNQKKMKIVSGRMIELKDTYKLNKLEFRYVGDAYSYINYGKPSIQNVVKNERKKIDIKTKRRIKLGKYLKRKNLPFDENMKECYEYINKIGTRSTKETSREIEIDIFLRTHTKYEKYLEENTKNKSRHLAYQEYIKDGKHFPQKIKYFSDVVLHFD